MREKAMNKVGLIRSLIAAAVMSAYGGVAAAQVAEVEDNSQISSAQMLTVDANGTVTASASFTTGDVDFYSFEGKAGDKVTIDIGDGMQNSLDLIVTLLGPNQFGPQQALTGNDDCNYPADIDPCIKSYTLLNDGVYYVGVTHAMAQVLDNGVLNGYFAGLPIAAGGYTLAITGVTPIAQAPQDPPPSQEPPAQDPPAVQSVSIDIRPGERAETATVHLSRAKIPVAILSSESFDATQIDPSTLTFGRTGDEQSLVRCFSKGVDMNRDRRRDMLCLFSIKKAEFEPNDLAGFLRGSTTTGNRFEGQGLLKVVEIKKRKHHRRHSHAWHDDRHDRDDDRWDRRDRHDDDWKRRR
jgi:hypothetical protein